MLGEARPYAERLFGFVDVNSLDEESAARVLAELAAVSGVKWDGDAIDEAVELTRGYPYLATR